MFYGSDENSRIMPGKKDYFSMNGLSIQKRLILSNLKDFHLCKTLCQPRSHNNLRVENFKCEYQPSDTLFDRSSNFVSQYTIFMTL